VKVSGVDAKVDVGIGPNGTFERGNVPLVLGTNTIMVQAIDHLGNMTPRMITVIRREPAGARLVAVSGDVQMTNILRRLASPLVVRATDSNGGPLAEKVLDFRVMRSSGRLWPLDSARVAADITISPNYTTNGVMHLPVKTDPSGEARVWWTMGIDAGNANNRVTVSAEGISEAVYFCASALALPARQINIGSGNNQRSETLGPAPEPLKVWVSDGNNPVPGVEVTFKVVQGGGRLLPIVTTNNTSPAGPGLRAASRPTASISLARQSSSLEGGTAEVKVLTSITGHAEVDFRFGVEAGNQLVEASFTGNVGTPATFVLYGVQRKAGQPTSFIGLVQDNALQPIVGAQCELVLGGSTNRVTSNFQGYFEFLNTPSGAGHLFVNGATATSIGTNVISTNSFPSLHYNVAVVPNAENSLLTPVLLPRLNTNNARWYAGTNDLILTCEGIEGLQMTVKAFSMRHPSGDLVTPERPAYVSLNQVHHDEIPMPMPDGASPPFAWTLQPGGATFDPPVQIEYPNMSGLAPGSAAYFLTFNHDTERFEIVGSGHVVDDGSAIISDLGAGLALAGWGSSCPPYPVSGEVSCTDDPVVLAKVDSLRAELSDANLRIQSHLSRSRALAQEILADLPTVIADLISFRQSVDEAKAGCQHCGPLPPLVKLACLAGCWLPALPQILNDLVGLNHKLSVLRDKLSQLDDNVLQAGIACGESMVLAREIAALCPTIEIEDCQTYFEARIQEFRDVVATPIRNSVGELGRKMAELENRARRYAECVSNPFLCSGRQSENNAVLALEAEEAALQRALSDAILANEDARLKVNTFKEGFPEFYETITTLHEDASPRNWRLVVTGQSAVPNLDGTYRIANISSSDSFGLSGPGSPPDGIGDGFVRLTGFKIKDGRVVRYLQSEPFQIRQGGIHHLQKLEYYDSVPGSYERIRAIVEQPILSAIGQRSRVRVTGWRSDGSTNDVSPRTEWTVYRTSNPRIALVDSNGFVTATGAGIAAITAVNDAATAVVRVNVAPSDTVASIQGSVLEPNGRPAENVNVQAILFEGETRLESIKTDATGRFNLTGVPTQSGLVTLKFQRAGAGGSWIAYVRDLDLAPGSLELPSVTLQRVQYSRIAAGSAHSAALKQDGTLWAWGRQQISGGTPAQVGTNANWITIAAGGSSTLALHEDGSLWGSALGAGGPTIQRLQLATNFTWRAVSTGGGGVTGGSHTIAIREDGTLWAWGINDDTQLGVPLPRAGTNRPVQVGTNANWQSIAAGSEHNIALRNDGTIWTWGRRSEGQLGTGFGPPIAPTRVGTNSNWQAIAAGWYHTLALRDDGKLWGWGLNEQGPLGDTQGTRNGPVPIFTNSTWRSIAAGGLFTLAIRADGTLWAWGQGALGDFPRGVFGTPSRVGTNSDWQEIAAGDKHAMALRSDGSLWTWGDALDGRLGRPINPVLRPTIVGNETAWIEAAAGGSHTLALQRDGTLWSWGRNSSGQLGNGTYMSRDYVLQIGSSRKWRAVAAGHGYSLAIDDAGALWAWGDNSGGKLGMPGLTDTNQPVLVNSDGDWKTVAAAAGHSAAIRGDGSLWTWGTNYYGELGIGQSSGTNRPARVGLASDWTAVAVESSRTVALRGDGTAWAWGRVGYGEITNSSQPVIIASDQRWREVAAGYEHTAMIRTDGTLWTWGKNFYGQLGNGTTISTNGLVQVETQAGWIAVAADSSHTLGIREDGLWAWGSYVGSSPQSRPALFSAAASWRTVTAGGHTLAISADGKLWAWGGNAYGESAQPTSRLPHAVPGNDWGPTP
jgi:alpha-tubulin suppressor-like RCC1 family protein